MDNPFCLSWLQELSPPLYIPDSNPPSDEEDAAANTLPVAEHQPQTTYITSGTQSTQHPMTYSDFSSHSQATVDAPPPLPKAFHGSPVDCFRPLTRTHACMKFFHEHQGTYFTKFELEPLLDVHAHGLAVYVSEINTVLRLHSLPTIEIEPLSRDEKADIMRKNPQLGNRAVTYSKKYRYQLLPHV